MMRDRQGCWQNSRCLQWLSTPQEKLKNSTQRHCNTLFNRASWLGYF
jgi:hypothetical protein